MPRGGTPKHPSQRRRRNKGPNGEPKGEQTTKLPQVPEVEVPPLPGRSKIGARGREWWEAIWRSPMAVVFVEADIPAIARGALLVHRFHTEDNPPAWVANELRQIEDRIGVTPGARRRLQWEIAHHAQSPARPGAAPPPDGAAPEPDEPTPDPDGVTDLDRYRRVTA